jgi:hypothetical protein
MNDLVWGVIIIGTLSAIVLVAMLRISHHLARRTSNLLAIMTVAMMLANSLLIYDSVFLTRILPVSNLVVVGNWSPLLVAILAGLIFWRVPGRSLRRIAIIGSLVVACLVAIYAPILSRPPRMQDRWDRGVCLQTSRASCSPAAAATLLNAYRIKTTEQEMAMLCLTSDKGTSTHGLWRGLKLKTAGTGYDVYMFSHGKLEDLPGMGPVLLTVELKRDADVDPIYERTWGWLPGVPHTVVLLGFRGPGQVQIADPAFGTETWAVEDLAVLWHGEGARLIRAKS